MQALASQSSQRPLDGPRRFPICFAALSPDLASIYSSLSVVIPAFNAASHVIATLTDVTDWLSRAAVPFETIVVDDGSTDATSALVREFGGGVRLLVNDRNRGKGFTVRRGMLATRCDWALFMDVDNSTAISHLERFARFAADHDVLIGSRRVAGAQIVRRQHAIRQMLGKTFPYLVRALALPDIGDTQCGFKLFRRSAVQTIFPQQRVDRFAFDVEILMLARRAGLRIREIEVDWNNPPQSTLRIRSDTFRMLYDLIRTAWRLR